MVEFEFRDFDRVFLKLPDVAKGAVSAEFVKAYLDATVMGKVRHKFSWLDWELEVERVPVDGSFSIRVVAIKREKGDGVKYVREHTIAYYEKSLQDALKEAVELVEKEVRVLTRLIIFRALELRG